MRPRVHPTTQLAKRLGLSPKNLKRYLAIVETPPEVQNAFERGDLKLDDAARIAGLDDEKQEDIAEAIREGENARAVVREYLTTSTVERTGLGPSYRRLLKHLEADIEVLDGRVENLPMADVAESDLDVLRAGRDLLGDMVEQIEQRQREQTKALAAMVEQINELRQRRPGRAPVGHSDVHLESTAIGS